MTLRHLIIIHIYGALWTTALVVWRNPGAEAHGQPWRYSLSMLLLAFIAWPLMLLAEATRTFWPRSKTSDGKRIS